MNPPVYIPELYPLLRLQPYHFPRHLIFRLFIHPPLIPGFLITVFFVDAGYILFSALSIGTSKN
jgi:hypothetical protein